MAQVERVTRCAGLVVLVEMGERISCPKALGRPAGRDAEKLTKAATALARGLSMAEIVVITGISRASFKRYARRVKNKILKINELFYYKSNVI